MKNMPSTSDPIKAYQRKSSAARRVGNNNRCTCGETRIEALVGNKGVCASCQRKKMGRPITDKHHVGGRANSPVTLEIWINDHWAVLSVAQHEWPKETLENPMGCPLRSAAGCIRGFIDTICHLIKRLLSWIAEMLELLSTLLIERLGPNWWSGTPVAQFARKG
jgi:hypothetical protein